MRSSSRGAKKPSAAEVRSAQNEPTQAPEGESPKILAGTALLSDRAWSEIARSLDLSGREVQIARAVLEDHKEVAVAEELGIAPRTVHTHVERLYRKLGVSDHSQLLARLFREFLLLTTSPQGTLPPVCRHETDGKCPLHPREL